jgi:hypothetical protein
MLFGDELPAGIGRPAMERCFLYVALPKRGTEKIPGKEFEPWRNARVTRDSLVVDPRGSVERAKRMTVGFDFKRADVTNGEIHD